MCEGSKGCLLTKIERYLWNNNKWFGPYYICCDLNKWSSNKIKNISKIIKVLKEEYKWVEIEKAKIKLRKWLIYELSIDNEDIDFSGIKDLIIAKLEIKLSELIKDL